MSAMKKLILITGAILIACVFAGNAAAPPPAETAVAAQQPAAQETGFVIRDCDGKIAVYRKGESAPMLITQTLTESLPRADAKRLRAGVDAPDRQTLEKLLEDYCS